MLFISLFDLTMPLWFCGTTYALSLLDKEVSFLRCFFFLLSAVSRFYFSHHSPLPLLMLFLCEYNELSELHRFVSEFLPLYLSLINWPRRVPVPTVAT